MTFRIASVLFCLLFANVPDRCAVQSEANSKTTPFKCSQPSAEREAQMREAEKSIFTVRRVEFIGLTYTHDQVVRDRMTSIVQEGDLFSREKLISSLQNMSKLKKSIYPLELKDVVMELNRSEQFVDMIVCFKQKPRRAGSGKRTAAS